MSILPNILIVDDNETNLFYLEIILHSIPAKLIRAKGGLEALEATRDTELSLAIIDVQMPSMNGYELAQRLMERSEQKIPIIFLTAAYPEDVKVQEGYEAGAVDYIIKPLNKKILVSKINIFLELYWQKQRLIQNTEKLIKSEKELRKAKQQLEQVNQNLIEAIEKERSAISLQVHDELGQAMTALNMDLNWVRRNLANKEETEKKLDAMIDATKKVIRKVQRISSELHPVVLDDLGLVAATEWYCEEFEKRTGIPCQLNLNETRQNLPSVNLTLFRILQEALTNIIRHARASAVSIELQNLQSETQMKISDNGIGLPPEKLTNGRSFGLIGMRQRVQQYGGNIYFSTQNGNGTSILVNIPNQ